MPDLCNIVPKHIEFHNDYIRIFLPRNKTDKYREGNYVYSASSSKYCHVGVLRGYLNLSGIDNNSTLPLKVKCDHRSKIFQFKQLERRSLKKIRASTGFEPMTSAIPVRCSTNWAMKPHIGSKVNLLSSFLPVQWNHVKYIWNNSYLYCGMRWKWSVIIAVNFPI